MLRILIVDDMPIFLDYLKGCIDWSTYGFQICGEAHDGIEALQLIETTYPDIILTDITMPYMDGLELAEKVAKHYPDISVLLITGNNEFEYARRAVKIGVCDYIVKPFEKEELLLSLLKQKDNINRALENKEQNDTLQRDVVLHKLILGRHSSWENHKESLAKANIHFVSDYFLVCTMKFFADQLEKLEQIHNWENIIEDMLIGKLVIDGQIFVFKNYENDIVILLNFESDKALKAYKTYELEDLNKIVKNQLEIDTIIGISDYCYSVNNIKDAYAQTMSIIYKSLEEKKNSGLVDESTEESSFVILNSWETIDNLNKGLEQLNEELILDTLRKEFEKFQGNIVSSQRAALFSSLVSILLTNIIKTGRSIDVVFGSDFHPYRAVHACNSLEDAKNLVTNYYLTAIHHREKHSNEKSHLVVERVKDYIHENYMSSELCIGDISKETLINQTYLRSMFKQETSLTITEYITKYRMTKAKELIETTDDKLSTIAEKVGFNDVSYFSKAFKKFYGVSPKSFYSVS